MAEIKWIKLDLDVFDNRKIRQIECLPDGDTIIVIWMKLLCLAGKVNDGGQVYLTEEIPYTEQMLAQQFGRSLSTVQVAMQVFERFGMIEIVDDILHVSNWEKYQNIEGMERIREQTRARVAKHRESKRLAASNATCNATVTQCNATDKEEDKNKKKNRKKNNNMPKSAYGENGNVLLTDDEFQKIVDAFPHDWNDRINNLSWYIASKGDKYKSHYATILSWARKDGPKKQTQQSYDPIADFMKGETNDKGGIW